MTTPSLENRSVTAMPSRTCLLVAAARAFGSRELDESLRNPDMLADQLIGPAELALISGHPLSQIGEREYAEAAHDPAIVFFVWAMLARTRFIDDALRRAVRNGAKQIVILGAGLDTRAYRFRELLQQCRVIEVDAEPTQQYKKHRLRAAMVDVPPNLTYARCDFACDSLSEVLRAAGYNAGEKTFYIWEGVCLYVPARRERATDPANHSGRVSEWQFPCVGLRKQDWDRDRREVSTRRVGSRGGMGRAVAFRCTRRHRRPRLFSRARMGHGRPRFLQQSREDQPIHQW